MPIHKQSGGYQWGNHGKVYHGKNARKKAERQAAAAHANGFHESKGGDVPLVHGKSKRAFKKNVETEMKAHPGNRSQDLAIAYSVQREAKKKRMARGGDVEGPAERANKHIEGVHRIDPVYKPPGEDHNQYGKVSHGEAHRFKNKDWETDRHNQVLEELRSMPKPKLEGLAHGGPVSPVSEELERKHSMRVPKHAKLSPVKHGKILHGKSFKVRDHSEDDMYAAGGEAKSKFATHGEEMRKYDEQKSEKGVHTPRGIGGMDKEKFGESRAGYATRAHAAKDEYTHVNPFTNKKEHVTPETFKQGAVKEHKRVLSELRAMPKPKLAQGGEVEDDFGSEDERLAEHDHDSHFSDEHLEERGERAEEDGEHVPAAHEDLSGPAEDEYMADHMEMLAHGGDVDEDLDLAHRVMKRRHRMAEGGQVDIDSNNEEQPNEYYERNEAAMKENYDEAMDDIDEGHSSLGDPEEEHEENDDDRDMISQIRRRMKSRR